MPSHSILQGDHLSRLAEEYGFVDYKTIWDDDGNEDLRESRPDPHVLFPGDTVSIPEKQQRSEQVATTQIHRFQVTTQNLNLRFVLEDIYGNPIADAICQFSVDGKVLDLTTGGDGGIDQRIPRMAEGGVLLLPDSPSSVNDVEIPFKIGHLDPVDQVTGQQARLNNLGYFAGEVGGDDTQSLRSAMEEFQCDFHLGVDGICGPQTQAAMLNAHGC